jgi:hypothetical protein
MQSVQVNDPGRSRLRFVFDGAVVSLSLGAHATFGEIARRLSELSRRRYGNPVAIDVTLGRDGAIRRYDGRIADFRDPVE